MPRRQVAELYLRVPHDVKQWIALQAERNGSSQNSEVIRLIRREMDAARVTEHSAAP